MISTTFLSELSAMNHLWTFVLCWILTAVGISFPNASVALADDSPTAEATESAQDAAAMQETAEHADGKTDDVGDEEQGDSDQGEQGENSDDDEEGDDDDTYTVERKRLKITVEAEGTFAAREMSPVKLDPEEWSTFEIEEIVPHGARVHAGEVLVKFDGKQLKEELDKLELELQINELSIRKAEAELPRIEKSIEKAFEQAERSLENARIDYENYQKIDRDLTIKSLEMRLKSAKQSTENAREELRQLERMYEADDLTEETEEIILKRQRAAVEQAEFGLEQAKLSYARNLDLVLPRNDISEKESLERVEIAYERAKTALETDLNRARYDLEKSKRSRAKSLERHAQLTRDLGLLELKSPVEGIVYYGKCTNGEWSDMASMIKKLQPEAEVPTGGTLMTIVEPGKLYLVTQVKEADRPSVQAGQPAKIQPTATGSNKLDARVSSVSDIPVAAGKFGMQLDLTASDLPDWLVAGMTGKAHVTTYDERTLWIPKEALHTDEEDDEVQYVWLIAEGQRERRDVATGKTNGDDVEIVDGLAAGDVISLKDKDEEHD